MESCSEDSIMNGSPPCGGDPTQPCHGPQPGGGDGPPGGGDNSPGGGDDFGATPQGEQRPAGGGIPPTAPTRDERMLARETAIKAMNWVKNCFKYISYQLTTIFRTNTSKTIFRTKKKIYRTYIKTNLSDKYILTNTEKHISDKHISDN